MKIKVPQERFVLNQRYRKICDIAYSYSYYENGSANVFQLTKEQLFQQIADSQSQTISVYCKTDYVFQLFDLIKNIDKKFILFTGCSDYPITEKIFSQKAKNVIKWFAENPDFKHQDLIPTPIGSLVGAWIGEENYAEDEYLKGHKDYVNIPTTNKEKVIENTVLLAFSLNTNFDERSLAHEALKDKSFVSDYCSEHSDNKRLTHEEFCKKIYNHEFVLSPPGNGIDCGRTWNSLQLGSIPIVRTSVITEYFRNKLPIFIYSDINEITEENLQNFKETANFNYDAIDVSYYNSLVKSIKNETD